MKPQRAQPLLTLNGIPPQVIGSLAEENMRGLLQQRAQIDKTIYWMPRRRDSALQRPMTLAELDGKSNLKDVEDAYVYLDAIRPVLEHLSNASVAMHAWGAQWKSLNIDIKCHTLTDEKPLIYSDSGSWHKDGDWLGGDELCVRYLMPTNNPAKFIDATDPEHFARRTEFLLNTEDDETNQNVPIENRSNNFSPEIETYAATHGLLRQPKAYEIMMFDEGAPHIVTPSLGRRGLLDIIQRYDMPPRWKERLAAGDAPVLK